VLRTVVDSWPVRFRLDDGMAMMPARKLSDFQTVIVEARISRSGNALPAAGDFVATSPTIRPRDGRPVTLTISRELT
jgi:cytochrome c-type biogenesis protein CcmH